MNTNFKTSMFGGFNKEDVIAYIEKNNKENKDKITELEEAHEQLMNENNNLQNRVYELEDDAQKLIETTAALEEITCKNLDLMKENADLKKLVDELRGPAEEYRGLKDHIADIEISAHKRTEEFRQKAIAELKAMIKKEREWCAAAKEIVQQKNQDILEKLKIAEETINESDFSPVEDILSSLSEFEENLK